MHPSPASHAQLVMASRMDERTLQQLVADLCKTLRLRHFHPLNSKGMTAGWPDSVIVGTKVIYRELKSAHGHPTAEQRAVGDALKAAGQDWAVWTPAQWLDGTIERELRLLQPATQLPFFAGWGG
jgi:hypothetical protein